MRLTTSIAAALVGLTLIAQAAQAAELHPTLASRDAAASRFTLSELIGLDSARSENDYGTWKFITSGDNRKVEKPGTVTPGKAQLAAQLGVDPADFTTSELMGLDSARSENDYGTWKFIISGDNRKVEKPGFVTPGKAQLAAQLGVNPADFTTSELIGLDSARSENDYGTWKFIISGDNRKVEKPGTATPGKVQLAAQLGLDSAFRGVGIQPRNDG